MSDVLTREDVIRETDYMQSFDADHLGLLGASNLLRNHDAAMRARVAELEGEVEQLMKERDGWRRAWIAIVGPGPGDLRYADERMKDGNPGSSLLQPADIRERLNAALARAEAAEAREAGLRDLLRKVLLAQALPWVGQDECYTVGDILRPDLRAKASAALAATAPAKGDAWTLPQDWRERALHDALEQVRDWDDASGAMDDDVRRAVDAALAAMRGGR